MSMTSRTRLLVPLAALAVAGCAQPARVNRQTEEQAIRAAGAEWRQNVAAREIDKIVALHTSDALVMYSNMPSATGSAGVRAGWAVSSRFRRTISRNRPGENSPTSMSSSQATT